jgi:transglutaminase-like putative cysteine protease
MKRDEFLIGTAALAATAAAWAPAGGMDDPFDPRPGPWRSYDVTTTLTLPPGKAAKAWVPIPSFAQPNWMRSGTTSWTSNAADVHLATDPRWNLQMVYAQWPESPEPRRLSVRSSASSRDFNVHDDPDRTPLTAAERERYLAPTKFIPTDGIMADTAAKVTAGAKSDLEKARRIYEWIVANTYRKASVRGCGLGNVAFMLETGDFGGKCADLNGLAVGLARASGIPARDLYGIRVAPSRFGYKSLGAKNADITHAQHCRAEVHLAEYGWFPIDPADVRKVILEEPPGNLSASDPKVVDARRTLFGAWEGNYMAYNTGADIALPGSAGEPIPFFMYPQAEVDGERLDSLDPASFAYDIKVS